ncbi:MAG TPA: choice-of-anchor tandem repeat GloVer-containing protein [Verrucomicrobiae bacterium]|nr:choice-of-anchor tandem repeat GloVer-containing protein [Verrucomicrobiae bacterium]
MPTQSASSNAELSSCNRLQTPVDLKSPSAAASSIFICVLLLLAALGVSPARAQGYKDLYDFAGSMAPSYPAVIFEGRNNNLYGVTATGGTSGNGTIFRIGPSGSFSVLYNFDGTHGSKPVGGLALGPDGDLYGMAEDGGANSYGNIFKISMAGAFSVLYDFKGTTDGGYPVSPLTLGSDGNFYGTSYPGYAFKVTPAGAFTLLSTIPGTSNGALVQASNGAFYGVTEYGGTHSAGAIYKLFGTTVTLIHSFDGPHGSYPFAGLALGADGNLYGTTTAGGTSNAGVIYRITPTGTYKVLVHFDNVNTLNGYQSFAGLISGADGNLYGATIWGGQFGNGVIFSISTDGAYSVLYNFDAPTGVGAYITPMQHTNGRIYGMTTRGGGAGKGVIYSFDEGLEPFVQLVTTSGPVGRSIGILGKGFSQATGVEFNGTAASFHVLSDTYMTTTVPSGETGFVTVETASGHLTSSRLFRVSPSLTGFSPTSGAVGTTLTLTGSGLIQMINITVGGVPVSVYTVNSDSQVTTRVPTGAKTGKIVVTTPGGTATRNDVFTVTQ